ncbi:hypothetical protein [Polaromonas aquatica]|uniref:hypothetical protein n=1 Tax=Polaromonas aquatica TaxID=332657 RepID=UPI003D655ECD
MLTLVRLLKRMGWAESTGLGRRQKHKSPQSVLVRAFICREAVLKISTTFSAVASSGYACSCA